MRQQQESDFRFTLTRSILLSDLLAFRDFLISKGHEVALSKRCKRAGGLDFSPPQSGGKYLRWCHFSNTGVDATCENFVHNPSTIVHQYLGGSPEWYWTNSISIRLMGIWNDKFSEKERRDIREGMVSCLGVIDNVIFNRTENRFVVLPEDESRYVDIFLEFDGAEEIRRWTIASTRFPLLVEERLFQCWHCKKDKPECSFDVEEVEDPSFYNVLECFVNSDAPCCCDCATELTRCDTPSPREVLVSQERKKKRRKT
jgi:hypothetical protein